MSYRVDTTLLDQLELESELIHMTLQGWEVVSVLFMGETGENRQVASFNKSGVIGMPIYKWCIIYKRKERKRWWQRG